MQGAAAVGGSVCGAHGGQDETDTMDTADLAFHDVLRAVVLGDILPQGIVLQVISDTGIAETDVITALYRLGVVVPQGAHRFLDLIAVYHLTGGNSGSGRCTACKLLIGACKNYCGAACLKGLGGIFAHQRSGLGQNGVDADHADLVRQADPVALLRHGSGHSSDGKCGTVGSNALGQRSCRNGKRIEAPEVDGVTLVLGHGALLTVLEEGKVGKQPGQQGAVVKGFLFSGKITVSLGSSSHSFIHSLIF